MPAKKAPVVVAKPSTPAAATPVAVAPAKAVAVAAKGAVKAPIVVPAPKAAAVAAVPVVVAAPAADAPAADVVSDDEASLNILIEKFASMASAFKEFQVLLKAHQKVFGRLQKQSKKAEKKRANARKTQSGFAKPSKLSNELCDFLKVPHGTEMARTAVTKLITSYIKEHKLNDQANKRKILPDALLKKLLNYSPEAGEELTYFNLQRYMKHQFVKAEPAVVAA